MALIKRKITSRLKSRVADKKKPLIKIFYEFKNFMFTQLLVNLISQGKNMGGSGKKKRLNKISTNKINIMKNLYLLLLSFALAACSTKPEMIREYVDLNGKWQFQLDTANIGVKNNWYSLNLSDSINLPGTTDLNCKGALNKDTSAMRLNRVYKCEGAAWYRKKVVIPPAMQDKHIALSLERTKASQVWIDSSFVGESKTLQSAQQFDVTGLLAPGEHYITIQINNDLKLTPYGNVHIYSDETQTNWNGIIGKLFLEAASKTYISNLQVYPDIDKRKIDIKMEIVNGLSLSNLDIDLIVEKTEHGQTKLLKPKKITTACKPVLELEYDLSVDCSLWDEYEQPIYKLTAVISNGEIKDSKTVPVWNEKIFR